MASEHDLRMRRFNEEAMKVLDEMRPDRYVVSDTTEDEDAEDAEDHEDAGWLDRAADRVATLLPDEAVKKLYARTIIGAKETAALKRGNRMIRQYYMDAQPQLGWLDTTGYPITVIHRITKPGQRVRIRRERVRISAMTPDDLRRFAAEERKNAARDFGTRNETCEAAEWMADRMIEAGASTVDAWVRSATQTEVAA